MWDSTGPKGGLGAKFERAMVSEVIGVGATVGDLVRGVRRDPLEIRAAVKVLKPADKNWSLAAANANSAVSPSEINHSSVPFPKQRDEKTDKNLYAGTTIEYAEQLTTLSLIALRRLRFPATGKTSPKIDAAGQYGSRGAWTLRSHACFRVRDGPALAVSALAGSGDELGIARKAG